MFRMSSKMFNNSLSHLMLSSYSHFSDSLQMSFPQLFCSKQEPVKVLGRWVPSPLIFAIISLKRSDQFVFQKSRFLYMSVSWQCVSQYLCSPPIDYKLETAPEVLIGASGVFLFFSFFI